MSGILRYFQPKLPSSSQVQMPPTILHEVNEAVTAALDEEKRGKKRKYNTSYTPEDRADIGRYAAENGNAAAVKKFN